MAYRLYIMPITGTGTANDPRRPIHADLMASETWGMMDFGFEPLCVVGGNFSTTTDTNLTAQSDVQALPFNLDQNLTSGAVTTVHDYLEAHNLPGDWVNTSLTYRQVVRVVLGVFIFFQRFNYVHGNVRLFQSGITLDTTVSQLSVQTRNDLATTASSLGYDFSAVTGSTTMRQLLKGMADQAAGSPIVINSVSI